jgi:hypothetical protein
MSACGTQRTSTSSLPMSAYEGSADMLFEMADFRVCRVGPGNFTLNLSQIRT